MLRSFFVVFLWLVLSLWIHGQNVENQRGVDPRVDYKQLLRFGPWDDRNYQLTFEDLAALPEGEEQLKIAIPAFFRVQLRKANPQWPTKGSAQYPRSAPELFREIYGGFLREGVLYGYTENQTTPETLATRNLDVPPGIQATVQQEIKISTAGGRAETAIAHNPVDPMKVIAGANGPSEQEMYYSENGGLSWTVAAGLSGNTCCDPTVAWSSDGTVAYTAALGNCWFLGCGVWFYRSTDGGQTWPTKITLTSSGSDKEYLHVDLSPDSPYLDHVYLAWHNGNVQQFARSLDRGLSFEPAIQFSSDPRGIGSDITTDRQGNVYYLWPGTDTNMIHVKKSTNGGQTFAPATAVASTNASFDWPIPAMDTRNVWVYVSADSDRSGGPFDGSVYACWADTTGAESSIPSQNHSRIVLAYSRDGGNQWQTTIPHATDDMNAVDRFNPWMQVDAQGNIHIIFYDTRRDITRLATDLFYTVSLDGGVSFLPAERITSEQSTKISDSFEYGDYNGLSLTTEQILPMFTDNRPSDAPDRINAYTADVLNEAQSGFFTLALDPLSLVFCQASGQPNPLTTTVRITAEEGFNEPVTLATSQWPEGISGEFEVNPVIAPAEVTLTLTLPNNTAPGFYELTVLASATAAPTQTQTLGLDLLPGGPEVPQLLYPLDGEPQAGTTSVRLGWTPVTHATSYRLQVSTDINFLTLWADESLSEPRKELTGLTVDQHFYWRVSAGNACQESAFSSPRQFLTHPTPILLVDQDNNEPDQAPFFVAALDALAVPFTLFDASLTTPLPEDYSDHDIVLWFSGDRGNGPLAEDLAHLASYLEQGGRLFLSSQELIHGLGSPSPDIRELLGFDTFVNDGGDFQSVTPTLEGIFSDLEEMPLSFPPGLADFSDALEAHPSGIVCLRGDNGHGAATQTAQSVFFAFPFGTLSSGGPQTSEEIQREVMGMILDHLQRCRTSDLTLEIPDFPPLCSGSQVTLEATPGGGTAPYTYQWEPAEFFDDPLSQTPEFSGTFSTDISLTVTEEGGCSVQAQQRIQIVPTSIQQLPPWRQEQPDIDPDGDGRITVADFCLAVNCSTPDQP
jgi:hypothetical protein